VASAFRIAFLSDPLVYVFLRACLLLESTGICNGAWVLAAIHKKIAGFQVDEVYIGTAEERAKNNMQDHNEELHLEAGHLAKLPGFAEHAPPALKHLMAANPAVAEYINSLHAMENGQENGSNDGSNEETIAEE
jgi:hypothetical protein